MRIDYSVPSNSYYVTKNFRYGFEHLKAAAYVIGIRYFCKIKAASYLETLLHISLGLTEMLPVIGHVLAEIDKKFMDRGIRVIKLTEKDPFKMGEEQGRLLKDEIHYCIGIGAKVFAPKMGALEIAKEYEKHLTDDQKQELLGIAKGAGITYEELLIANVMIDRLVGCSLLAYTNNGTEKRIDRLVATNHFPSKNNPLIGHGNGDSTLERYNALKDHEIDPELSVPNAIKALRSANYYDTVQSMVFDVNNGDLHLAIAGGYGANREFTKIKLFDIPEKSKRLVRLARNLDWPFPMLGPETIVIVRPETETKKSTAIVGWPGMIGALSGMNQEGLCLAISVDLFVNSEAIFFPQIATPNPFLFRRILENSSTTNEARDEVEGTNISSSMNLLVAAKDGICHMELDPTREKQGYAHIERISDEKEEKVVLQKGFFENALFKISSFFSSNKVA